MDHKKETKKDIEILPAILPKSFEDLKNHLIRVRNLVETVQVDLTDGRFVPSTTWPYNQKDSEEAQKIFSQEEGLPFWQDFNFEFDLMLENQVEEAQKWIEAGAFRIIFHVEALSENSSKEISILKEKKIIETGFSLNTDTPVEKLEPFLELIDSIQCMGIAKVGFQGQDFDHKVISQIKKVQEFFQEKNKICPPIAVDGAVNLETAQKLLEAGANKLVVGSALFESVDLKETLEIFKNLL